MNVCPICTRSYKRPEHLRRHLQSHSSNRPYTCDNCDSSFQRTDVLRRHQQTCKTPSTENLEPLPKRIALSPTARPVQNEASDLPTARVPDLYEQPLWSNQPYPSFDHIAGWVVNTSDAPEIDIWQEFLNTSSGTFNPDLVQHETPGSSRLGFLDKFTSKTGLAYSFDCGTDEQRQYFALNHMTGAATKRQEDESSLQYAPEAGLTAQDPHQHDTSMPQWLSDPLAFKSQEIIASIKDIMVNKTRQSCITLSWSSAVQGACLSFFSSSNIRRYLDLYWALWHPNVNIVHKPTFDPAASKAYLVAAMCLMGASVSPVPADSASAKLWYNCVEELVFLSDDLCDDVQLVRCRDTGKQKWRRDHLRALQAAYLVLLYQNWEGSDSSKRRIRRLRFSTVVAVVRDVGIPNALHPDYTTHSKSYDFPWSDFIATEELVRVVLWVFLVDTAFVIFNNLPPRMVITEMSISPACPESCFQASTAESCFEGLRDTDLSTRPCTTFGQMFESLYDQPVDAATRNHLAELGPLNLFAMTSALHSLVFHYRSSFSCRGSLTDIKRALANWSLVWTLYTQHHAQTLRHNPASKPSQDLRGADMWRRIGFMCHAEEYWYLAKLMVEYHDPDPEPDTTISKVRSRSRTDPQLDDGLLDLDGMTDQELAQEDVASNTSKGRIVEERLRNYDETSMRQINDLIAEFRRAEI